MVSRPANAPRTNYSQTLHPGPPPPPTTATTTSPQETTSPRRPPPPPPPTHPPPHRTTSNSVHSTLLHFLTIQHPPPTHPPPHPPLKNQIYVPTTNPTLSSGFPYPLQLQFPATTGGSESRPPTSTSSTNTNTNTSSSTSRSNNPSAITPKDWALFSNTLANLGRLTRREKCLVVAEGWIWCLLTCFSGRRGVKSEIEKVRRRAEVRRVIGFVDGDTKRGWKRKWVSGKLNGGDGGGGGGNSNGEDRGGNEGGNNDGSDKLLLPEIPIADQAVHLAEEREERQSAKRNGNNKRGIRRRLSHALHVLSRGGGSDDDELGDGDGDGDGQQQHQEGKDTLPSLLALWNHMFFEPRGVHVELEGPMDLLAELELDPSIAIVPPALMAVGGSGGGGGGGSARRGSGSAGRGSGEGKKGGRKHGRKGTDDGDDDGVAEMMNRFRIVLMPFPEEGGRKGSNSSGSGSGL